MNLGYFPFLSSSDHIAFLDLPQKEQRCNIVVRKGKCKTSAQGLSRKGVKKIEHVSRRKGWVLK